MGSYISCTQSASAWKASTRTTKVIFPSGELRQLGEPVKAAELMLEIPNSFVVNARSVQIGRRFSALSADEDLEIGNIYAFFPMSRVNSVVTAADIGALFLVANSSAKRDGRAGGRILPECGADSQSGADKRAAVKLNLDDVEEFSMPEFKRRMTVCRSKKPLLETIVEEPVCLG